MCFLNNKTASAATTMESTDPTAETMVISINVNPKITQKSWKEMDYSLKIKHKVLEKNDYYTRLLDCQRQPRRIRQDT